jgi:hypothetical protein
MQHLMNLALSIAKRNRSMDLWINEGLSMAAEYVWGEAHLDINWLWYNVDRTGLIEKGNNFFVWNNHLSVDPAAVIDDYATVYLFFRWLYLQANSEQRASLFSQIVRSPYYDHRAVTSIASTINPAWHNWETLLMTWFAANYDPQNAVYGYIGDRYLQEGYGSRNPHFQGIRVHPIRGSSVSLFPGEGVYSIIHNNFTPPDGGNNIRYAGLSPGSPTAGSTLRPITGDVLLTFNANADTFGRRESGRLTGVSPPASRTLQGTHIRQFAGPYVLDAKDVLGRNREREAAVFLNSPLELKQ